MNNINQTVDNLLSKAKKAQSLFEKYDQKEVDKVVIATAWAVLNPENNDFLSRLSVEQTGIGDVEDKKIKNYRKTIGLLRDIKDAKTVGVINEYLERGIIEIARPVGVVGALLPSTNPVATPLNKTLNALKGRNSIILAPSPKGDYVCDKLIQLIHKELTRVSAPKDLVQKLPSPTSKEQTYNLMAKVDLVVVTGSQSNVRKAYSSGTPAIGVGTGNASVIVDSSADIEDAVSKIVKSKIFDNATSCSSENSLIILDAVYKKTLETLERHGGVILKPGDKKALQDKMWFQGSLSKEVIGKSIKDICNYVGFSELRLTKAKFFMVKEEGIGKDYPFSGEKLSPILTIYHAFDFDDAFNKLKAILEFQGKGHSCGIHTNSEEHIMRLGLELPVCRVIVKQAHCIANGGNFDNGLPFSLSMGCGTWGRNSISDNMNYRHYLNITRIVRTITPREPSMVDIFGDYWKEYNLK